MANYIVPGSKVLFLQRTGEPFSSPLKLCSGILQEYRMVGGGKVWHNQFTCGSEICVIEFEGNVLTDNTRKDIRKDTPKNRAYFKRLGYEIDS